MLYTHFTQEVLGFQDVKVTKIESNEKELIIHAELERKEQMLRSILDGMPVATYLKDLDGNITYENSMAKDFLGLSDSEFANKWDYEANRVNEIAKEDNE